jgi:hypothetical protein
MTLITLRSRYLQKLKEQQAKQGISTDPGTLLQIEDIEAELEKLQAELDRLAPESAAVLEAGGLTPKAEGRSRPTVFISYSHEDEQDKNRLLKHLGVLQSAGLVTTWSDDRIGAGADWRREIEQTMAQARVAVLLVTANFLTSDFILNTEVPTLLQRHRQAGLIIFPIIARPCAWKMVGWLQQMQVRPKNGRPVWGDGGSHVDDDLAAIAEELAAAVGSSQ